MFMFVLTSLCQTTPVKTLAENLFKLNFESRNNDVSTLAFFGIECDVFLNVFLLDSIDAWVVLVKPVVEVSVNSNVLSPGCFSLTFGFNLVKREYILAFRLQKDIFKPFLFNKVRDWLSS
jgi:hypothetical protein